MPFEMTCGRCGFVLFWGIDVKAVRDVLRQYGYHCRHCGVKLSSEFEVEVVPASNLVMNTNSNPDMFTKRDVKLQNEPIDAS